MAKETITVKNVEQKSGAKGAYLIIDTGNEKLACYDTGSFSDFVVGNVLNVEIIASASGNRYIKGSYGGIGMPSTKLSTNDTNLSIIAQVSLKAAVELAVAGKLPKDEGERKELAETADWIMTVILALQNSRK